MKKNRIMNLVCAGALLVSGVYAFGGTALENRVERAAAAARLGRHQSYMVDATVYFKEQILLKDRMLRAPRRPANPNQVIGISKSQKQCRGVVVSKGAQVIVPAVCVTDGDASLDKMTIHLKTGQTLEIAAPAVAIKEDVAWVSVDPAQLKSVPYVVVMPVSQGQSLQDAFGDKMTDHLRRFFRERGVMEKRHLRPGMVYNASRLQVGEPLFYKGKVVALVKARARTYGGLFGGVSESALAIIR